MAKEFSEDTKNKVLLWSDRHCCLCKKACGVDIQVHHIIPKEKKGTGVIDNAIPLCYDCHAKVHYSSLQGNSIKPNELKRRRDQIYEEFTHHLLSPVMFLLTQRGGREFPSIGFDIRNTGNTYPIGVRVDLYAYAKRKEIHFKKGENGYYSGRHIWNLNPGKGFINANFILPDYMMPVGFTELTAEEQSSYKLQIRIKLTIIDILEREHELLPEGFIYSPTIQSEQKWYAEP
ncbi:HNH endonuclease [Pelolinea submarina]|uniref:HNH endonuclease n=1 Tax=Pelolinea submarina TaxID=913107 RepID=A0A347ZW64_9CHLR|nr:HNH endonuclease [Pelolinea submarina]REG07241.1 HNH endonuclease [Pelolinea submarina]BBB49545.1 hypothetical protein Pelsub_P2776 [Pelolinea submarina]